MEYSGISTPAWINAEHTLINCTVTFKHLGAVQFTADPLDMYEHSKEIFDFCAAGNAGPILEYIEPLIQIECAFFVATEPQPIATGTQTL